MQNNVLHIDASARLQGSVSRDLSAGIVALQNAQSITARDLSQGIPFLDENWVTATFIPPTERTEAQAAALSFSDVLVQEVQEADTIVIGVAMYNFNIPATLKAWIDQIARAGVTFRYGENGPEGLLNGKKVVIAMATGGVPVGSDYDFASPYLRQVFGFLGITDVTILDSQAVGELTAAA